MIPDESLNSGVASRAFPRTSWTLIRKLQQLSGTSQRALYDDWIKHYWKPIYAYFRARGQSEERAQDLVQDFLTKFLERDKIREVESTGLKFRTWLRAIAKNYLIDAVRRENAGIRQPTGGVVSFEALRSLDGDPFEPAATESPEAAFDDAWRREVLDGALKQMEEECRNSGRQDHYAAFVGYYVLPEGDSRPRWQDIAAQLNLAGAEIAERHAYWVKRRLARCIWEIVRETVDTDAEADEEIRELLH